MFPGMAADRVAGYNAARWLVDGDQFSYKFFISPVQQYHVDAVAVSPFLDRQVGTKITKRSSWLRVTIIVSYSSSHSAEMHASVTTDRTFSPSF